MKDEEEISRMLASLKTVDAPDNFEGGVRSRIAQRREQPSVLRPVLLLAVKFALPLLLLLGIGGFLIVSDERSVNADLVPPVGDETHGVAVTDEPSISERSGDPSTNDVNTRIAQAPVNRVGGNSRPAPLGGSEDIGLSQDETTLFPDGVDPRNANVTNGKPPTGGTISPQSVLSIIGISSDCSSAGCVATSIREGSIAAKAGLQKGDVISAIDGRPVNASTNITGRFTVSEITLVRSGRRITVSIARR